MQSSDAAVSRPRSSRRRRRHHRGTVADRVAIPLLILAPTLGWVLFGGVRLGVAGPLMIAVFAAAGVLVVQAILRREDGAGWRIPPGWIPLACFGLYAAVMIPRAAVPHEALVEVLKVASYLAAYWAWCELGAVNRRWRVLLAIPLAVASLICLYAIVQHAQGTRMVLWLERPEGYGMRASGTHICPNHFAQLLSMFMVLGVAVATIRSAGWPLRILGIYTAAISLPVLLLTASRSGWIGLVAGLGAFIAVRSARAGWKRFILTSFLFLLLITAAGGALWKGSALFRQRVEQAFRGDVRPALWQDSVGLIEAAPAWGHGGGAYRWVFPAYQHVLVQESNYVRYAHNEYLHLAADYGLFGAALLGLALLVFVVRVLAALVRARDAKVVGLSAGLLGCFAALLAHSFFDFNLHIFANVHLLAMVAGVGVGVLYGAGDLQARRVPRAAARLLAVAALAGLALAATLTVRVSAGQVLAERAEKSRIDLKLDRAERLAQRAVRADPDNWRGYAQRGHVFKTRGFWDLDPAASGDFARAAIDAYERALTLNPHDRYTKLEMSRALGDLLGEKDKAVSLLEEIIEDAPANFQYRAELGLRLRRMGRLEEALAAFQAARKINPKDEMVNLNIRSLRRLIASQAEAE